MSGRGGHAVAAHGHVGYTNDLDAWLQASSANAALVMQVSRDFAFASLESGEEDVSVAGLMVQIGREPARIGLLTDVLGREIEQAGDGASARSCGRG
ncbi:MAG TPA: hypothetical protein VFN13_01340 [Rudaea sp.]|nr:hypothetical protein [Rudaea sp.]